MLRALALSLLLVPGALAQPTLVPRVYGLRLTLEAPANWGTLRDQGLVRLAVLAPPAAGFRPNVNVVVEGVPEGFDLEAYVAANQDVLAQTVPGYRAIESERATLGGRAAHRMVYEHTTGGRPLRALFYAFVESGRAFALTATATPAAFEDYLPLFEQISQSIQTD